MTREDFNRIVAEELSNIIEAAKVDTSRYKRSHGKDPKGSGNWLFSFNEKGDDAFEVGGYMSYANAKKEAQKKAKEAGEKYVYVMESVNEAKVKVGDILYKDGRKGKVVKVMDDMANVDFGKGDVYGITFRRIKGNKIVESVNEVSTKEYIEHLENIRNDFYNRGLKSKAAEVQADIDKLTKNEELVNEADFAKRYAKAFAKATGNQPALKRGDKVRITNPASPGMKKYKNKVGVVDTVHSDGYVMVRVKGYGSRAMEFRPDELVSEVVTENTENMKKAVQRAIEKYMRMKADDYEFLDATGEFDIDAGYDVGVHGTKVAQEKMVNDLNKMLGKLGLNAVVSAGEHFSDDQIDQKYYEVLVRMNDVVDEATIINPEDIDYKEDAKGKYIEDSFGTKIYVQEDMKKKGMEGNIEDLLSAKQLQYYRKHEDAIMDMLIADRSLSAPEAVEKHMKQPTRANIGNLFIVKDANGHIHLEIGGRSGQMNLGYAGTPRVKKFIEIIKDFAKKRKR